MPSFELLAVICLVILAFGGLIVGVVNDAVNFLNSAIGAKVSSRKVIMIIAGIGIIIGATFSDGIIEVARKGIFYPEFFSLHEAIILFAAVAFANVILLDLYSTFGLPTSTTVAVVFGLLGSASTLAFWKMGSFEEAWTVINSTSAIKIIIGIVMSIGIAFVAGLIGQFITRLTFTFDYKERFKRWGFLWSSVALTSLLFFILFKGGKHATFMTDDVKNWIDTNLWQILAVSFAFFAGLSQVLIRKELNILKFIVLIGTASLAMAFAGNDLANFIGVSVAGVNAYLGADLSGTLPTPAWVLILSGLVMAIAIFTSKKAKTVTKTEINLTSHEKDAKTHWKSNPLLEKLTNLIIFIHKTFSKIIPKRGRAAIASRWARNHDHNGDGAAFDLLRASVNLMIAAAVISFATSKKLPLSTTYVTFMVAMGTSLADKAWTRECAPYRISGVLTVIGGWFITALLIFLISGATVTVLYFTEAYGLIALTVMLSFAVYKLFHLHDRRSTT
ncbi:hypothetical protein HOE67_02620 [Candidatus Peregrinibacteria bacterium]|nr:hypothetical protein [Candidatus Peregrinibacteria bacterium]MBT4055980.1 hypothetical protein [Candidatus Peregrinibacteria bacterium]